MYGCLPRPPFHVNMQSMLTQPTDCLTVIRPTLRDPCPARQNDREIQQHSAYACGVILPASAHTHETCTARYMQSINLYLQTWNVWVPASAPTPCARATHAKSTNENPADIQNMECKCACLGTCSMNCAPHANGRINELIDMMPTKADK